MPSSGRFTTSTLSRLEPHIHGVIKDILGFSEPSLLTVAVNTVQEGGQERDIKKRLSSLLDKRKASKLAGKIMGVVEEFCITHELPTGREDSAPVKQAPPDSAAAIAAKLAVAKANLELSRKRQLDEEASEGGASPAKAAKTDDDAPTTVSAMSADQIRAMMSNTMKQIQERKKQLTSLQSDKVAKSSGIGPQRSPAAPAAPGGDKTQTLAALQAQIASRMEKVQAQLPPPAVVPDRPTPVILDDAGRTVDAAGQHVQLSQHVPTLKANLRAKRRDEMREHLRDVPVEQAGQQDSVFFDPRVGLKGTQARARRTNFKFNEPGKFQQEGNRLRMKAQLERLQADISTIARKTGIQSATQLAKLVPRDAAGGVCADVPDVEWWDAHIMAPGAGGYDGAKLRDGAITNLIEHPIQMMPLEPNKPDHLTVFLTKKERKKLRRQNRREAWKEKQDKIRLGLLPPDEPKVKMSNLMRVLGNEAVQDPTRVEAHVRDQMAKRLANHEKANQDRKLTPEQKKEKNERKLKEDTNFGVHVSVYRVKSLQNPSKKFKVETNAKQLYMTGCIVLYEDVNVVVVEGGPKQQKKYKQLMLNRIKWDEEAYKDKDGAEVDNACSLVWEGQTKERNFGEIRLKQCPTESFARDFFSKQSVEHYWDQAYSGAVLEDTEAF